MRVAIIIPALNEAGSIGAVVEDCLRHCSTDDNMRVVVCDNGSGDGTPDAAQRAGAEVVFERCRGYGAACQCAIRHLADWPDVFVFVDGDGACDLRELPALLAPFRRHEADLVIGRRQSVESGAMMPAQRLGNWWFCTLLRMRWGVAYHDLGPFRAIRRAALARLDMSDTTWGWTLEMQIKAIVRRLRVVEIPVTWRTRRAGCSKISGRVWGAMRAGGKITWTFLRYVLYGRAVCGRRRNVVIAFVKYPQAGMVKTRLGAAVGHNEAARIYRRLAESTLGELIALQASGSVEVVVCFDGRKAGDYERWLSGALFYWPQPSGDLGARLGAGFERAFAQGAEHVAAVGTDCPGLTAVQVGQAFAELCDADVCIIPNTDGGYALIATKKFSPRLFEDIDWSTSSVLEQTRARAAELGLMVRELAAIPDIDTVDDLVHLPAAYIYA